MEIIVIIGYLGALGIGFALGLIGGGGSILTVPIFVYILHISPVTATAYSLFVVGTTSLIGSIQNFNKRLIHLKTAIIFAIPSLIAVYTTRKYIVTNIPELLFSVDSIVITRDIGIMIFFALIMLLASLSMLHRKEHVGTKESKTSFPYYVVILEGVVVGVLTGLVGAGGGFLIIPALVLVAKLPMKKAIATSLLIISVKSLLGFMGDVQNLNIDWFFLLTFTSIAVLGIFIGMYVSTFIEGKKLEKGFGWLVLLMSIAIITKELFYE